MQYTNFLIIIQNLLAIHNALAPLHKPKNSISGHYLVNLKSNSRNPIDLHLDQVRTFFTSRTGFNQIQKVYKNVGNVYYANFSDDVLNKVRALPEVDFVEMDSKVSVSSVQNNAPWGLSRVSQRQFINKSTYSYDGDGSGVAVYVLDTGIQVGHTEFGGRAIWGANFVSGSPNSDDNGHGTHCAGTIGSRSYGIAKNVNLVAVKVLNSNGDGTWSSIIAGINWAAGDKRGRNGNILNISISGDKSNSANNAVDAAVNSGLMVVVAAGNNNSDACNYSPASASNVLTVAGSDINDQKDRYSNYGRCVDIIAPGTDILSTWNNGGTKLMSGTSMATPHVAGLSAYFLSKYSFTVQQLKSHLQSISTKNMATGFSSDTINYIAYNNIS